MLDLDGILYYSRQFQNKAQIVSESLYSDAW